MLVDSACTRTMMERHLVLSLGLPLILVRQSISMINGARSEISEECDMSLQMSGRSVMLRAVVVERLVAGCEILLGVDGIDACGGVWVGRGMVRFGSEGCAGRVEPELGLAEGKAGAVRGVAASGVVLTTDEGVNMVVEAGADEGNAVAECTGHIELGLGFAEGKTDAVREGVAASGVVLTTDEGMETVVKAGSNVAAGGKVVAEEVSKGLPGKEVVVEGEDFTARFDGSRWVVGWKWEADPPCLNNRCAGYHVSPDDRPAFETEVETWIEEGILMPHDPVRHGEVKALIPLMAVVQENKGKVRPVLDYRELNKHVKSVPSADVDVCGEKLREWRKRGEDVEMLDLRKAYLQLHVRDELHCYQAVRFRGCVYVLTRLGFGLTSAPKIMTKVLGKVLSLREDVRLGTGSYIDDIMVDTSVVSSETVRQHLQEFGLVCKEPVPLSQARVLGLKVYSGGDGKPLRWRRDNTLPERGTQLTKRQVFSICGQLVGHYPVCRWLRVHCSYLKRLACSGRWDDEVSSEVVSLLGETCARVEAEDPVSGRWAVPRATSGRVWCDASSLAMGACLEVGGHVVEDASWLRKESDGAHINLAELEALLKGLNIGIMWGLTTMELVTDSATVFGWVSSVIQNSKRPKVSGLGEMLVRRRLAMVAELVEAYKLSLSVTLVQSAKNKADELTRVPKRWLKAGGKGHPIEPTCAAGVDASQAENVVRLSEPTCATVVDAALVKDAVRRSHERHHLGVQRTFFLAERELGGVVTLPVVEDIVRNCNACCSIDPAPVQRDKGEVGVESTWDRVAVDITHYEGSPYLTLIDCGPSRFAIWKKLRQETGGEVSAHVEQILRERGAPRELMSDNGPCFQSHSFSEMLSRWGVRHIFSCAYRPSGNGIIERNHRTVKRMAARAGGDVRDMVTYYNASPNCHGKVPAEAVYKYVMQPLGVAADQVVDDASVSCRYSVGDRVYVKPPNARCTTPWGPGTVTGITSSTAVLVDGMTRHVRDLRKVPGGRDTELTSVVVESNQCRVGRMLHADTDSDSDDSGACEAVQRPTRDRRAPGWTRDYAM